MALWIKTDGTITEIEPANKIEFTVDEVKTCVGGYFEAVPYASALIMYVHEEGALIGLPYNTKASQMLREKQPNRVHTDVYGNVLIASLVETGDESNVLHVQTTPTKAACTECGTSPSLEWNLYGMTGTLCKDCLGKEVININAALQSRQDEPTHQDFLDALNPDNWQKSSMLHTPTTDISVLDNGDVQFTLPDCQFELKPEETDALIRYLFRDFYDLPRIVCLVGSTSEPDAFRLANLQETKAGKIVLSIGIDTKSDADLLVTGEITEEDKAWLDELHKRKIDLADEILVVSKHIGESTRSEIYYAQVNNKLIRYVHPENDPLENLKPKRVDPEQEQG